MKRTAKPKASINPAKRDQQQVETIDSERTSTNGLYRQWKILSKLAATKWVGTRQIEEQLKYEGINISLRTIQRDLNQLAERFPIESNNSVPQGWRWQQGADILSLPIMSSSQAVTFMMVEEHLRHLLPPSLLSEMRPWFDLAKKSLLHDGNVVTDWVNRVRIVPPTQPLIPPSVLHDAQQAIYEALLYEKQLAIHYQKRGSLLEAGEPYQINPLALVQRGAVIYVICTHANRADKPATDMSNVRYFPLHRFKQATILDTAVVKPHGFNLDAYLDSGALGFKDTQSPSLEHLNIELVFTKTSGQSLLESKLSKDQTIEIIEVIEVTDSAKTATTHSEATTTEPENTTIIKSTYIKVTATVPMTQQLVWWLRGFGKGLTQIKPQMLFDAVHEII